MSIGNLVANTLKSLAVEVYRVVGFDDAAGKIRVQKYVASGDFDVYTINKPIMAGASGAGIFYTPPIGSNIICVRVPDFPEQTVCIGTLPNDFQLAPSKFKKTPPLHTPSGNVPYPKTNKDVLAVQGSSGDKLIFEKTGVKLENSFGQGLQYIKNRVGTNAFENYTNKVEFSDSGYSVKGQVKRLPEGGLVSTSGRIDNLNRVDKEQLSKGNSIGIFPKSKTRRVKVNKALKNPSRTENRSITNQYSSQFTGFDTEVQVFNKNKPSNPGKNTGRINQANNFNNILNLAPHQLTESISGNVISPLGEILDANFEGLKIGDQGFVPKNDPVRAFLDASEIEKRALGVFFQLDTNSNSDDFSDNRENFVTSINKEGFFTINIPKTSDTGLVFKNKKVTFWDGANGSIYEDDIGFSKFEDVPITYRDDKLTLPKKPVSISSVVNEGQRETGVLYSGLNRFRSNSKSDDALSERLFHTKHHNMPAAGEMLLGNLVAKIQIPTFFSNFKTGQSESSPMFKPFEVFNNSISNNTDDKFENDFMSTVKIRPSVPAIDPGSRNDGSSIYCGLSESNISNGPYSNNFAFEVEESNPKNSEPSFEQDTLRTGGKSASINLQGSFDLSVGKDNRDEKSILLDTAGSMIAWFGKDSNGRSLVVQTDGDVAFNVGGGSGETFNSGRFDLRVNVTDKGTLSDPTNEEISEPGNNSDYLISIGAHGIVIAGMSDQPMLIRNKKDICIESSEGELKLVGFAGIKYKESLDTIKDLSMSTTEKNSKDSESDILNQG